VTAQAEGESARCRTNRIQPCGGRKASQSVPIDAIVTTVVATNAQEASIMRWPLSTRNTFITSPAAVPLAKRP
jgi:hypothetical protein